MAENLVSGSCGGQGGHEWSYEPKGDEVRTNIYINYEEEAIYSISFVTLYEDGKVEQPVFGGGGGEGKKDGKIELDGKIEKLNGISGTVDTYQGAQVITSLRFTTVDNISYGPFGSARGAPFSINGGNDHVVSGFYGRAGFWLDAIGVYMHPI